jgi:hypothetical protein
MWATHRKAAAISLLASGLAAAAYAFEPFEHGRWLVAYLFLVGFAAQALLARGQEKLQFRASPDIAARICAQTVLWNVGVILVPAGVMIDARLPVLVGGIALLLSLVGFARTAAASPRVSGELSRSRWRAQVAMIIFMATSVLVGTSLAWDKPWL